MQTGNAGLVDHDEWVFAPATIRRPPGRVLAGGIGVLIVALVGAVVLLSGSERAPTTTEVLGRSETVPTSYTFSFGTPDAVATPVSYEIVELHEDGSAVVDMTLDRTSSVGGGVLRLVVASDGTVASIQGVGGPLAAGDVRVGASEAPRFDLLADGKTTGDTWPDTVKLAIAKQ